MMREEREEGKYIVGESESKKESKKERETLKNQEKE